MTTVTLYAAQYFVGMWNFWFPGARMETRRAYHPMHVFFGIFIYFLANFTIMTGVQERAPQHAHSLVLLCRQSCPRTLR